ncbi:MAG: acyltransferase [Gemmataceae bacterium]
MAGVFRFLLAILVVVFHLVPAAFVGHWGPFAVYSFYLLSGYLMTLVLHRTYGFTLLGGGRFAVNRVLRLFPTYYGVCLISLALLAGYGGAMTAFHAALRFPADGRSVLANLLLVPQLYWYEVRLAPPTWSLAVELVCYAALWLWVARSARLAWLTAGATAAYTAYLIATGAAFPVRYTALFTSLLPFALGAVAFLHRDQLLAWCNGRVRLVVILLFVVNLFAAPTLFRKDPLLWPFYGNVLLTFLVTPFAVDVRLPGGRLRDLDDWAGRLTYPVFLAHYPVAFAVHQLIGGPSRSLLLCLLTLPPLLAVSYLLCRYVEMPVERWRARVRTGRLTTPVEASPGEWAGGERKAA